MGSKKPPKVKASKYQSPYASVSSYQTDIGGISGSTSKNEGGVLKSQTYLDPTLQESLNNVKAGLARNTSYFTQPVEARMQNIASGGNDFYNALKLQNDDLFKDTVDNLYLGMGSRGLESSTLMGGLLGQASRDKASSDLQSRLGALQYLDQAAAMENSILGQNLQTMFGLQLQPAQMTQQAQQTGYSAVDQMNQFNAQAQQQADTTNAQMQMQAQAQQRAMWGQLAAAGLTLATLPMGGAGGLLGKGLSSLAGMGLKSAAAPAMAGGLANWGANYGAGLLRKY